MNRKVLMPLMISAALGIAYCILLLLFYGNAIFGASSLLSFVLGALAAAFVIPHIVVVIIAAVFNVVAVIARSKTFALLSGIFYSLGAVLFVFFSVFLVPSIILCFIGYSKLKDAQTELNESNDNEPK
jgi:hypothetical protein